MKSFQRNSSETAKVHQQNILDRLQHRLDAARAKGNAGLIQQLEQEMQQVRSGSSPSSGYVPTPMPSPKQVATTHQQNLRENVERRLASAQAKGDEALIQQLEQELRQLG